MCAVLRARKRPAAIEGTDREGFTTIEEVRSSVGRHLMHGRNGRAIVQATTAAVGDAAFATVQSVLRLNPKRMDAVGLRFERAAEYQSCGDTGNGN